MSDQHNKLYTMSNIQLSVIVFRSNIKNALACGQIYLNITPDFQRQYDAWDIKLKTRFIETILIGRAMNPIWTIFNPHDNSEEILDGMHRLRTAIDFMNDVFVLNSKHFTQLSYNNYDKKRFKDLTIDDKNKIRNYNFMFNQLDSSYRTDINKRRDMYEILNRSSKTLNEFEFNKVLYNKFYSAIGDYKQPLNIFMAKKDKRGSGEMEIICLLALSSKLPNTWSSLPSLSNGWLMKSLGVTEQSINKFLTNNMINIVSKIELIKYIINMLTYKQLLLVNSEHFRQHMLLYKFIVTRIAFALRNIDALDKHKTDICATINNVLTTFTLTERQNLTRNTTLQREIIDRIDKYIHETLL